MADLAFTRKSWILTAVIVWSFPGSNGDSLESILQDVRALMFNYSFAMDMGVPEDKALVKTIPTSFSERLDALKIINPEKKASVISGLLVSAVTAVLKAQSNILKDRLAKQDKNVRPLDVLRSSNWITHLLELLLSNRLVAPLVLETALPALQLSVELRLTTVAQLLLSSLDKQHRSYKEAVASLIPAAIAVQSSHMLDVLLAEFAKARTSAVAEVLIMPSTKMAGKSAYEIALKKCTYLPSSAHLWSGYGDLHCVPGCLAVDWLITSAVNSQSHTDRSWSREQKFEELCTLLRYSKLESSSSDLKMTDSEHLQEATALPQLDGGWRRGAFLFSLDSHQTESCEVPCVDVAEFTDEAFQHLVHLSLPVIIRNTAMYSELLPLFSRKSLLKILGSVDLLVGDIPYASVFGKRDGVASGKEFGEYMDKQWHLYKQSVQKWKHGSLLNEQAPLYVFDEQVIGAELNKTNQQKFMLPDVFDIWKNRLYQFIWGPPGSGSPVHFHCPAVNLMMYGRKRWWLYPPGDAFYSKVHPVEAWPEKASHQILHCLQQPGDMLFIPSHWAHSTVNVDEVVGLAVEFNTRQC